MLYIDLETHTLKKGKTVLILNGIPQNGYKIDPSPITMEYIEQLYKAFKYSVPNGVKYKKNYFLALPEEKLTVEDLIIGQNRSAAKETLELALLTGILNGSLMWPEGNTQWFMQPALERDKDFVLLRKWFLKNENLQSEAEEKASDSKKAASPETQNSTQPVIETDNTKENGDTTMTNENKKSDTTNTNAIICDGQYYPVTPEVMQLIRDYQKLMEEATATKEKLESHLSTSKVTNNVTTKTSEKNIKENISDNIEKAIREDGYIPSQHLWRRWIMAQMLRHYRGTNASSPKEAFDKYFISGRPYSYSWKTALRELKALSHMKGSELAKRERFFNLKVIKSMAEHYEDRFWKYFYKLPVKIKERFKKNKNKNKYAYRLIPHFGEIYNENNNETYKKKSRRYFTFEELENRINEAVCQIKEASDYKSMITAVNKLIKTCPMNCNISKADEWKNAFKGAGAYYTMDNMIKFHNCVFYSGKTPLTQQESLDELEKYTDMFDNQYLEYYKLYAVMCEFIKDNHFDFDKRLDELKAAKNA